MKKTGTITLAILAIFLFIFEFLQVSSVKTLHVGIVLLVSVLGIVIYDEKKQFSSKWTAALKLIFFSLLMFLVVFETEKQRFLFLVSGTAIFLSLVSESRSQKWSGGFYFSTMVWPVLAFSALIMASGFPKLAANETLYFELLAFFSLALFELPAVLRGRAQDFYGDSFVSLRVLFVSFATYLYSVKFLPEAAKSDNFFYGIGFAAAVLSLILAGLSLLRTKIWDKQALFNVIWTLFMFWSSLFFHESLISGLVAAAFFSWLQVTLIKENSASVLWGFAAPGSILFFSGLGMVLGHDNGAVRGQQILWVFVFLVVWLGLFLVKSFEKQITLKELTLRQKTLFIINILIVFSFITKTGIENLRELFQ